MKKGRFLLSHCKMFAPFDKLRANGEGKSHNSRIQSGYLIVELLVYCVLIAGIMLITLEWAVGHYVRSAQREQEQEVTTQLYMAQCVLIRDVQRSVMPFVQWKQHSPNNYIWSVENGDVGWQVSEQQLIRIQGRYDQITHTWHDKSKGLIACGVHALEIVPCNDSSSILCKLTGTHHKSCSRKVSIRNGVLV